MWPVDSKPIFFFLQAHDANNMVNNEGMTYSCFELLFLTEKIQAVSLYYKELLRCVCCLEATLYEIGMNNDAVDMDANNEGAI